MSNLVIEVLSASVNTVPTAKGSYQALELAYKNKSFQDKVEGKKLMSFDKMEKDTFKVLLNAKLGDVFTITRDKDEKGYWKWTSATAGNVEPQQTGASMAATPVSKPQYETADERAARQIMIVRQSSLANAVAALKVDKVQLKAGEVIELAKEFEAYVLGKDSATVSDAFDGLDDPI